MHEQFTPAVIHAIEAARLWANHNDCSEVEPLHLLFGLLKEREGRPFGLLVRAGTDKDGLAAFVPDFPDQKHRETAELTLDAAAENALRGAQNLRRELMLTDSVSSEMVLVALLRGSELVRRELERLGLDVATVEAEVLDALQGPPLQMDEPLRLDDPADKIATTRILDAGANRAHEALRVLEDYCRFLRDDAILTAELKSLRHDLTATMDCVPLPVRLAARETERDVGTNIATPSENARFSADSVVRANIKRLQESLRSLEEFSKLVDSDMARRVENMRYRSYTLERMLLLGQAARDRLVDLKLCVLLTARQCWGSLQWTLREAAAGGAGIFQLREKEFSDRDLLARARNVRRWTRETETLFIVNDRPDIARLVHADGVHLGQDDMPVREARQILGTAGLIGVSTHDIEQVRRAARDGADYIGVGPTFPSGTKQFDDLAGLDFVRQASAETTLPTFVIGGVNAGNLSQTINAGAKRIAVSGAVCGSETPQAAAKALRQMLDMVTCQ